MPCDLGMVYHLDWRKYGRNSRTPFSLTHETDLDLLFLQRLSVCAFLGCLLAWLVKNITVENRWLTGHCQLTKMIFFFFSCKQSENLLRLQVLHIPPEALSEHCEGSKFSVSSKAD